MTTTTDRADETTKKEQQIAKTETVTTLPAAKTLKTTHPQKTNNQPKFSSCQNPVNIRFDAMVPLNIVKQGNC